MYAFLLKPALWHSWAIPNNFTLLSYTQSYHIVEVYPTLKHCWAIHCLSTLSNEERSKDTVVGFRATLSAAYQNRVKCHPIAQWKIDLTKLQADNLITTCTYVGAQLKPMPWKEILYINHHAIVSVGWFMSMRFEKQFPKWLEGRNDQGTARKAWRDYMVDWYLNKLDFSCDRKPLPFRDINPTNLNHTIWK